MVYTSMLLRVEGSRKTSSEFYWNDLDYRILFFELKKKSFYITDDKIYEIYYSENHKISRLILEQHGVMLCYVKAK